MKEVEDGELEEEMGPLPQGDAPNTLPNGVSPPRFHHYCNRHAANAVSRSQMCLYNNCMYFMTVCICSVVDST